MISDVFLGLFLSICTLTDIRAGEIKAGVLAVFGLAGMGLFIWLRPVSIFEEVSGLLFGIVFIGLWALTEGKIGLGDGLMMIVTGIYLGGRENGALIMTAMLLSAVYSVFFLLIRKADKNTAFAFAPFVLISFILRSIIPIWR